MRCIHIHIMKHVMWERQWGCRLNFHTFAFQGEHPYPWPMFSSNPPPHCYSLEPLIFHQNSQGDGNADKAASLNPHIVWWRPTSSFSVIESEITAFLASSKDSTNNESWVEMCQRHYRKVLTSNSNVLSGKCKYKWWENVFLLKVMTTDIVLPGNTRIYHTRYTLCVIVTRANFIFWLPLIC